MFSFNLPAGMRPPSYRVAGMTQTWTAESGEEPYYVVKVRKLMCSVPPSPSVPPASPVSSLRRPTLVPCRAKTQRQIRHRPILVSSSGRARVLCVWHTPDVLCTLLHHTSRTYVTATCPHCTHPALHGLPTTHARGLVHIPAITIYCSPKFQQMASEGQHEMYLMGLEAGSKKAAVGIIRSWTRAGEPSDNTKVCERGVGGCPGRGGGQFVHKDTYYV